MALITSDCGAMRLPGHQMALITSGLCATGAVDWQSAVFLNGKQIGNNTGEQVNGGCHRYFELRGTLRLKVYYLAVWAPWLLW